MASLFEAERALQGFVRWLLGAKPKCGTYHYIFRYRWSLSVWERVKRMREMASRGICPFCGERHRKLFTHILRHHRFEVMELIEEGIGKKLFSTD